MLNSESMCSVHVQHVWHMYIFVGTGVGERVSYPRVHADDGFEALDTVDQLVPETTVVHAHLGSGLCHSLQGALTYMYSCTYMCMYTMYKIKLYLHVHRYMYVLHYIHKGEVTIPTVHCTDTYTYADLSHAVFVHSSPCCCSLIRISFL